MSLVYRDEFYNHPTIKQQKKFRKFLEKQGLEYENNVEMTLKVVDEATGEMIGTGSIDGKVLKCIAIDPSRRGEGLSAHILSQLVKEQHNRGRYHIFVFTSPDNIEESAGNVFAGFSKVAETDEIVLLEMGSRKINDYLLELKDKTSNVQREGIIGSIVVNCNPFTLGHQFLIETSAKECDFLYVFVVTENRSLFPTDVRLELVKMGTKHLKNVLVLEGGDYIISPATFPRYFLKECDDISYSQARLDVKIFRDYIIPTLNISRRYVGEEPYCLVTRSYNDAMKEILVPSDIELIIIPRKKRNGEAISASKVRELIKKNEFDKIKKLVPKTTYEFLLTKKAKPIIDKIKNVDSRH